MARKKTGRELQRDIDEAIGGNRRRRNGGSRSAGRWKGTEVQSLLFERPQWTPSKAKTWAKKHGFVSRKVHETDDYVRLRQFSPLATAQKRTITFGKGIKAVVEQLK